VTRLQRVSTTGENNLALQDINICDY